MISTKQYKCTKCKSDFKCDTNHYGEIYRTPCCGFGAVGKLIDSIPEGVVIPQPWTKVALSDILRVVKVA